MLNWQNTQGAGWGGEWDGKVVRGGHRPPHRPAGARSRSDRRQGASSSRFPGQALAEIPGGGGGRPKTRVPLRVWGVVEKGCEDQGSEVVLLPALCRSLLLFLGP